MISSEKQVAGYLLDVGAVQLRPAEPFTWASGWKSPIYCDNRKLLSFPQIRTAIRDLTVRTIEDHFKTVDVIAGVATGAIAMGALVAEKMDKPFIYVRPKPKDHGMENQIEGVFNRGDRVVVIEDLISTGTSSLSAANALSAAGCIVEGMVAVFSYNFPSARREFEYKSGLEVYTLSNYDALIQTAVERKLISEADIEMLRGWRFKPETWGV
ncbi:MAG: orotate phosphoribosyltransferase [Bacteroidales bacterium]|nr:orotate phosphoribosyltransferase [Bacteroidales bacterium]